ncbi:MAG: hypothetical protein M3Y08_14035 [Fibrobacterota bacterium]|nr:hypothetical protein [Fibrobacterota bacterium]
MNLYAETILFGAQIATIFFLAGPVMVRAERQKSLSRNPGWVFLQPGFLEANGKVSLAPVLAVGILLEVMLGAAFSMASPAAMFAVHVPGCLLGILGLIHHYGKQEARLRDLIPKDALQRAPLVPRSLFRLLSPWVVIPLVALLAGSLCINGYGFFQTTIPVERMLGNFALIGIFSALVAFSFLNTIKRRPYRVSAETDGLARKFELQVIAATGYFFAAVVVFHSVGSIGPEPIFRHPPTLLHAWFEGTSFSWEHFFRDAPYRIVVYTTTLFLILLSVWVAVNRFHRKVLAVDFRSAPDPIEV